MADRRTFLRDLSSRSVIGEDETVAAAVKVEGMQQKAMAMSFVRAVIGQIGIARREVVL